MKQKRTWVFYISLLAQLNIGFSQEKEGNLIVNDTIELKNKTPLSLRFGIDLYRLTLSQISDEFNGFEAVGDLRVGEKFFMALEIGNVETTRQVEQVNFTSNGSYYKIGFDYNMYQNLEGMNNHITLGLRFATSNHSQFLNSYTILDRTRFWPGSDFPINQGFATGERVDLNAQWFEVVVSFKVQIFKNIYTGLSLRLNRLIKDKLPENFENVYIPGFNKKTEENVFGAGFNYTLTYNLPLGLRKKSN